MESITLRHPTDRTKFRSLEKEEVSEFETLLVEVRVKGKRVMEFPSLEDMRSKRELDVSRLDPGVRRLVYPHIYHVSLTERLYQLKQELVASALGEGS